VRLAYLDGDMDLGPLENADTSGILDSMGIGHLLGAARPSWPACSGLAGAPPLIAPDRLALLGADPRETTDDGRRKLRDLGVFFSEGPSLIADPVGAARRALDALGAAGPLLVHFDVDVIDSGDLPLGNYPHYGSGVTAGHAFAALRELCAHPALSGLVLTEVNPPTTRQAAC